MTNLAWALFALLPFASAAVRVSAPAPAAVGSFSAAASVGAARISLSAPSLSPLVAPSGVLTLPSVITAPAPAVFSAAATMDGPAVSALPSGQARGAAANFASPILSLNAETESAPIQPSARPSVVSQFQEDAAGAQESGRQAKPESVLASLQAQASLLAPRPGQALGALKSSGKFFDGSGEGAAGDSISGRSAPEVQPTLPRGLKRVTAVVARNASDIERLIPNNSNTVNLKSELKKKIRHRPALPLLIYEDSMGGSFVGIDLRSDPAWLADIPDLDEHERHHIKKILRKFSDVQVVVREEGKTPDLVVNGVLTELKADFGDLSLGRLVEKANLQIDAFKRGHHIVEGDLALDLREYDKVPVGDVNRQLNEWASKARFVALDRIWVYAGDRDVQVFKRSETDRFDWEGAGDRPGAASPAAVDPRRLREAQALAKRGRIAEAERMLAHLEAQAGPSQDPHWDLKMARGTIAAYRLLGRIKKLMARPGGLAAARLLWTKFQVSQHEEIVAEIAAAAEKLVGGGAVDLKPRTSGALAEQGVRQTVAVYGGEHVKPAAEAQAALDMVLGRGAEESRVLRARRAVSLSRYYDLAGRFAGLAGRAGKGQLAVATKGGSGIAAAANRAAREAGAPSAAFRLKKRQKSAPDATKGLDFEFTSDAERDAALREGAAAHVFFPGGFSTAEDLLGLLTRMQSRAARPAPIILAGDRADWDKELDLNSLISKGLIEEETAGRVVYAATAEEAWAAASEGLK